MGLNQFCCSLNCSPQFNLVIRFLHLSIYGSSWMLHVHVTGGSNPRKGDILVIAGATLYAISNVSEVRWLQFLLLFFFSSNVFYQVFSIKNMAHYLGIIIAKQSTASSKCNCQTSDWVVHFLVTAEPGRFRSYRFVACLLIYFLLWCLQKSCILPFLCFRIWILKCFSMWLCEDWELHYFPWVVFRSLFDWDQKSTNCCYSDVFAVVN